MKKILSVVTMVAVLGTGAFASEREVKSTDLVPFFVHTIIGGLIGGPFGLGVGMFTGGAVSMFSIEQDKPTVEALIDLKQ